MSRMNVYGITNRQHGRESKVIHFNTGAILVDCEQKFLIHIIKAKNWFSMLPSCPHILWGPAWCCSFTRESNTQNQMLWLLLFGWHLSSSLIAIWAQLSNYLSCQCVHASKINPQQIGSSQSAAPCYIKTINMQTTSRDTRYSVVGAPDEWWQ